MKKTSNGCKNYCNFNAVCWSPVDRPVLSVQKVFAINDKQLYNNQKCSKKSWLIPVNDSDPIGTTAKFVSWSLNIYSILYAHLLKIVSGMNELYDNWDYESPKTIK